MNYQKFSLLYGFTVWLLGTLAFRWWGAYFFITDNPLVILTFFAATVPAMVLAIHWVFRKYKLADAERAKSVILMALPGMLLDVFVVQLTKFIYPAFTANDTITFSSWLLWVYAVVLLLGVIKTKKMAF